jgi:multidrug efflux pump subunit AcrA (membrane-fusion protein)
MERDEKHHRKRSRGWIAALLVLLLAGGGAAAAWYLNGSEEADAPREERATPVVVEPVARGTARDTVTTVGEVLARNAITVRSEVAGRVAAVPVEDGSMVREGEVLIRLDADREEAALAAAEARANEARLQFARA